MDTCAINFFFFDIHNLILDSISSIVLDLLYIFYKLTLLNCLIVFHYQLSEKVNHFCVKI